jgi:hypothetical protein
MIPEVRAAACNTVEIVGDTVATYPSNQLQQQSNKIAAASYMNKCKELRRPAALS